jgi:MFS family permease
VTRSTRRTALFTTPFILVLALGFLGFSIEQLIRPVVPLIVLSRGGDVVLVGVISALPVIPSIVLRPLVGTLVDGPRHRQLFQAGALVEAVAPSLLLAPGLVLVACSRLLHGTGWAMYSVSAQSLMARLAPPERRAEASAYYLATPALAALVFPALGLALYVQGGEILPVVLATCLGLTAALVIRRARFPATGLVSRPSSAGHETRRAYHLERSALPSTLMITTFMSGHALFTIFPPVYAVHIGAPVEALVAYYPLYGLTLLISQAVLGRASDVIGRGVSIRFGCVLGILGLAVAGVGGQIETLAAGAVAYAIGVAFAAPAISAMAIDKAPAGRLGSAMATYSMGHQLASNGSSALWGALIAAAGFEWTFAGAIVLQLITIGLSNSWWIARFAPSV